MLSKSDESEVQELKIFHGDKLSFPERKGQAQQVSHTNFRVEL